MATFVRTTSGRWKAVIRRKGHPTVCKTFRLKKDAEYWARQIEDEIARGIYQDRRNAEQVTLNEALDRYLAEVSPNKARGAEQRERSTARPLREHLGKYSLSRLTPRQIAEYRDQRLKTINRFGRKMSVDQVRLELALLSHLFSVAIREWGYGLPFNPVQRVKKPAAGPGRDRRLTKDEERRLLAACSEYSNPKLLWIVQLALETGMRKGEILGIRLGQLDGRLLRLPATQTKNRRRRIIPLTRKAREILVEAMSNPLRPDDTDLVFWGDGRDRNGNRKPWDLERAWRWARSRAGISDLRFHDLRHEAISRFGEMGIPPLLIAAISGHRDLRMLQRYSHPDVSYILKLFDERIGPSGDF